MEIVPSDLLIFKTRLIGLVYDTNDFTEKINYRLSINHEFVDIYWYIIDYFEAIYGPHMYDAATLKIHQLAKDLFAQIIIPRLNQN